MTSIKVYKLDGIGKENTFLLLAEGEHTIGRDLFQSTDKRISRKHATISIRKDSITLKSEHVNSCFHKSFTDNNISRLSKDESITLNNNDHFALVSDGFWYEVQIIREDGNEEIKSCSNLLSSDVIHTFNLASPSKKRNNHDDDDDIIIISPSKKQKISEKCEHVEDHFLGTYEEQKKSELNDACKDENEEKCQQIGTEEKEILSAGTKPNLNEGGVVDSDLSLNNCETKVQTKKSIRDRCWYGQECYRKNVQHRDNFSHPGDNDYDSDQDDNRPNCPYGLACYRVNIFHRREFKHRGKPAPKPPIMNGCAFCTHCYVNNFYR